MAAGPLTHDKALFETLAAEAQRLDPALRTGRVFGCPALYKGRKLAACVYGNSVGMRLPGALAAASLRAGRAGAFRPYGRPEMREWIQIEGGAAAIAASRDLLAAAIAFAQVNDGG